MRKEGSYLLSKGLAGWHDTLNGILQNAINGLEELRLGNWLGWVKGKHASGRMQQGFRGSEGQIK